MMRSSIQSFLRDLNSNFLTFADFGCPLRLMLENMMGFPLNYAFIYESEIADDRSIM